MSGRRSARHSRPTGRRGLEQAHVALQDDVSRLRTERYADHLEVVRLTALVEGLVSHVQRLAVELAQLRRELQIARTAPQQRDPAVAQLAAEVADLRATAAIQQTLLSDLSGRLLDVMSRLGPDPWSAHPDATPPHPVSRAAEAGAPLLAAAEPDGSRGSALAAASDADSAADATGDPSADPALRAGAAELAAAPAAPLTHDLRDPAFPTVPDYPPAGEDRVLTLGGIPASVSAAAAEMSLREPILAEVAASTPGFRQFAPSATDVETLDDETVLRLRMIRESFGR
jgi:hypothetical protein